MGLTKPDRALRLYSLQSTSQKLLTLAPGPFPQTHFGWLSWIQSSLSDRVLRGFSKSQKSFLLSPSRCSARIRFCPCTFFLFINDLPASLSSSVSCSLYADDLAIRSSFPSVPTAVDATQGALFRLERWSK